MTKVGIFMPHMKGVKILFDEAKKEIGYKGDIVLIEPKNDLEKQEALKDVDVVISSPLTIKEIEKAEKLKFIQVPYAGVEGFDLGLLGDSGIMLANVHGNATSVAEHAFGLLLALAKGIVKGDKDLRQGFWHGWMSREPNIEIEGKTVCIVGLGNIGKKVAQFAKAFDMYVVGVKKNVTEMPNVDKVYGVAHTKDAIARADFIVIAVPITEETKGFISMDTLKLMKGKYLINVSRGTAIDEKDLFIALKNHILKGAAIDTWWIYPKSPYEFQYPSHYPFWLLDNIILSPHTAGYSVSSIKKNWEEAVKNVVNFIAGKEVKNVVSIEKGY